MSSKPKWPKDFGLTIALLSLFLVTIACQIFFGMKAYNEDRVEHKVAPLESVTDYLRSGHFVGSVSENMESEFLQMAVFVILTMCLIQRGASESKKPEDEKESAEIKEDLEEQRIHNIRKKQYPLVWVLYENSLTLVLFLIFVFFFSLHAFGSFTSINEKNVWNHRALISFFEVFKESEFWFESFQNWQSEFFSIAALSILSIFLRQYGSPQSKKITDPLWKTGSD